VLFRCDDGDVIVPAQKLLDVLYTGIDKLHHFFIQSRKGDDRLFGSFTAGCDRGTGGERVWAQGFIY
jgi:hypothetical protein